MMIILLAVLYWKGVPYGYIFTNMHKFIEMCIFKKFSTQMSFMLIFGDIISFRILLVVSRKLLGSWSV